MELPLIHFDDDDDDIYFYPVLWEYKNGLLLSIMTHAIFYLKEIMIVVLKNTTI